MKALQNTGACTMRSWKEQTPKAKSNSGPPQTQTKNTLSRSSTQFEPSPKRLWTGGRPGGNEPKEAPLERHQRVGEALAIRLDKDFENTEQGARNQKTAKSRKPLKRMYRISEQGAKCWKRTEDFQKKGRQYFSKRSKSLPGMPGGDFSQIAR